MSSSSLIGLMDNAEESNVTEHQGEGNQRKCDWQKGARLSYGGIHLGDIVFLVFHTDVSAGRTAVVDLLKVYPRRRREAIPHVFFEEHSSALIRKVLLIHLSLRITKSATEPSPTRKMLMTDVAQWLPHDLRAREPCGSHWSYVARSEWAKMINILHKVAYLNGQVPH